MGSSISTIIIQALQIPAMLQSSLGLGGVIWPAQTKLINNSIYDYIVIGGGSAGSVVATRLVEDQKNSVLMLENGGNPPITTFFAALFPLLPKSNVDYDYRSTYDPYAAGGQGNHTTLTAGKMLGGCDSLNHFIHTRGCPSDQNSWAKITEDESWNYKNFLPYFIKSERVDDKDIVSKYPQFHGTKGPMGLSRQTSKKTKNYLESFAEVGIPTVLDINAGTTPIGYTQPLFMLADRIRQTPAKSYLGKVKDNPNLYVSKKTRVTKIIFEGNVAKAVVAIYKRKKYIFRAKKEIILSAGVFNTPQILMLSGIGPEEHLNEIGIEVKANLPVGEGFKDQVSTTLVFRTEKAILPIPSPSLLATDPTKIPFPLIAGSVALNKSQKCPDYQTYGFFLAHDTPLLTLACRNTFWYRKDICDSWQKQVAGYNSFYTVLANVAPKSEGTVRLKSKNPFDNPVITTGYLTDKRDLRNMVKFVKHFIKVGSSSYFKKIKAKLIGLNLKECRDKKPGSDAFWKCYVINRIISPYHYTSTCAMGRVVDSKLKVIGFERLRVIDASVMPKPPSGAPNAVVIALAEKGADLIKQESYY